MPRYADFHQRSISDREGFWAEQAKLVDWQQPFETVCDHANPPFARWFAGGKTNLCHNAVDRHLKERAGQNALIFVSTETGQEKVYSFGELHAEVQRLAAIRAIPSIKRVCRQVPLCCPGAAVQTSLRVQHHDH